MFGRMADGAMRNGSPVAGEKSMIGTPAALRFTRVAPLVVIVKVSGSQVGLPAAFHSEIPSRGVTELGRRMSWLYTSKLALIVVVENGLYVVATYARRVMS